MAVRKHSIFERYSLIAATATVAAHANARAEGFRQRDVRFLMDLFCNWMQNPSPSALVVIQNTQVLRYLRELERNGYLRGIRSGKHPLYRLTRIGLIELISEAVGGAGVETPAHFFFLFYFIDSYREKIFELVKAEGKQFPYALELELQGLLDSKQLIVREIKNAERKLKELDVRVREGHKAAQLTREMSAKGVPYGDIAKKWEELYPYALNSHKPLTELFSEIAPDLARWEMETGSVSRVEKMWEPCRTLHTRYIETLRAMGGKR